MSSGLFACIGVAAAALMCGCCFWLGMLHGREIQREQPGCHDQVFIVSGEGRDQCRDGAQLAEWFGGTPGQIAARCICPREVKP